MNDSILSDQINPNAEMAEQGCGEATNPQFRRSDPPSLCYGVASQIKASAEMAEHESGEATSSVPIPQSDPPSRCYDGASQLKAEAKSAVEEERGEAILSGQIKAEAESQYF